MAGLLVAALAATPVAYHRPDSVDSPRWTTEYDAHFQKYSKHFFGPFFDWRLFKAQAIVESRLNPHARSPAGAQGLMQIKPSTFREIRRTNPNWHDAREISHHIAAAIYYDHYLYQRNAWAQMEREERLRFTLAAYNAGTTGIMRAMNASAPPVKAWSQVSPKAPPETRAYVAQITGIWQASQRGPQLRGVAAQFEARRRFAAERRAQAAGG